MQSDKTLLKPANDKQEGGGGGGRTWRLSDVIVTPRGLTANSAKANSD